MKVFLKLTHYPGGILVHSTCDISQWALPLSEADECALPTPIPTSPVGRRKEQPSRVRQTEAVWSRRLPGLSSLVRHWRCARGPHGGKLNADSPSFRTVTERP